MLCFNSEKMNWYYHVLARRPYFVVIFLSVFCLACIIVSLVMNHLPDFSDPILGFETRGTDIGNRLTAWHNLLRETSEGSESLVADPNNLIRNQHNSLEDNGFILHRKRKNRRKHKNKRRKHKTHTTQTIKSNEKLLNKKVLEFKKRLKATSQPATTEQPADEWAGDNGIFRDYEITNDSSTLDSEALKRSEHFEYGTNTTSIDEALHREKMQTKKSTWRILKQAGSIPATWSENDVRQPIEGFFCDSPYKEYSHFVIKRIGPNATDSLFDLHGFLAMCQLQEQIASVPSYKEYCQREMLSDKCCRPWSLSNYAALLANKSSCFDLTVDDVTSLQNLLVICFEYFHDLKLSNDCNEYNRCYAPAECTRNNMVYNILHFLTDYNFIKSNDSGVYLKYAMIFMPVVHSTKILPLFHEWEKVELQNELVQVIGMDLGLENELFNELLLTDVWLVSLGGVFVMACMWLYTNSSFITIMSCFAVCFSLGLAYFVYTIVFDLSFFPYMNLLAIVVIIGIGADDVFLFVKIWQCVLAERFSKSTNTQSTIDAEHTESLQNLMALTMRHAAASMLVTSATTAGAFYSSYSSSITAIKCFGLFAGTVVITNYLLMITWLPASVSIMERISTSSSACNQIQIQKLLLTCNKSINKFCQFFENMIIDMVMHYAYFWILCFGAIGIASAIIVLYWPGLQLPENSHFQLFVSDHPFEMYNSHLKNEFWFEKSLSSYENFNMPLRFVWGILPVDDGDYTNPFAHGSLHYDNNFNISTIDAQIWLLDFCRDLRLQSFYQHMSGFLLPNCFIENFIDFMKRRCIDGMDTTRTDRTPCCDAKFPYEPHIFQFCLPQSISDLYATPRQFFIPGVAGPKFAAASSIYHIDTEFETSAEYFESNNSAIRFNATKAIVKALVIEFESNITYTTIFDDMHKFYVNVEHWFKERLSTAPTELKNGWFTSELKFYNVQDTLQHDTLVAISLAMCAALVVLFLVTFNILISVFAVITVLFTIFTTVAVLILLGWKLNILESIAVSTAIGLAVDFSLHYGIHFRLSPIKERLGATQFALTRIIGPTVMAATTTGFAGGIMMASNILPYIQIGIFLLVVMVISWFYATFFLMSLLKTAGPEYGYMQFTCPKISKHNNINGTKYYERKPSKVVASEQLLTPSSSALGELVNSETHELESLNSNNLIKTISGNENANTHNIGHTDYEHSFQSDKYLDDKIICTVPLHNYAVNYQSPSTSKNSSKNMELLSVANAKLF